MKASALVAVVGSLFVTVVALVPGCKEDEEPQEQPQGNSIKCGSAVCDSVLLPDPYPPIKACCPTGGGCGLDGTQFEQYGANFDDPCQPLDQPGELDTECAESTPVPTEQFGDLIFDGCCTPAGRCGYMLD